MDIPFEVITPIATAVIAAVGGYAVARANRDAGREQKLTDIADARLKLLMDSYEKRQRSLVDQLEASERRVVVLTRQYEQRIETLLRKIDAYERRLAERVAGIEHNDEREDHHA